MEIVDSGISIVLSLHVLTGSWESGNKCWLILYCPWSIMKLLFIYSVCLIHVCDGCHFTLSQHLTSC